MIDFEPIFNSLWSARAKGECVRQWSWKAKFGRALYNRRAMKAWPWAGTRLMCAFISCRVHRVRARCYIIVTCIPMKLKRWTAINTAGTLVNNALRKSVLTSRADKNSASLCSAREWLYNAPKTFSMPIRLI